MKQLVLAIDFDGTIAEENWPHIGNQRYNAGFFLRKLKEDGHTIIINTCRSGKFEGDAQAFLDEHNIPYDYINSNLPRRIQKYKQDCRKISADIYIDDKCVMGLPHWEEIYSRICQKANE